MGGGQPVVNVVTVEGASTAHERTSLEVEIKPIKICCDAKYRVGFSSELLSNATPGEGIVDGSDTCLAAGGTIKATGPTTVYANTLSNADVGVQGFSMSIEVTGDVDVVDVTVDGTASAQANSGGFNNTSVADPAASGGRRGAVSAIVLNFTMAVVFDPVGTESILALSVASEAETATGRLFFASGLVGSGQPVDNVLTVSGASGEVCNFDLADVTIAITEILDLGPYVRGDANADGKVDIGDPIWTINELFRDGPETGCQLAADANGDGAVDLADAMYAIAFSFQGGPSPSAPFPGCDVTPVDEAGDLTCEVEQACE